jgi:hypothetical protein
MNSCGICAGSRSCGRTPTTDISRSRNSMGRPWTYSPGCVRDDLWARILPLLNNDDARAIVIGSRRLKHWPPSLRPPGGPAHNSTQSGAAGSPYWANQDGISNGMSGRAIYNYCSPRPGGKTPRDCSQRIWGTVEGVTRALLGAAGWWIRSGRPVLSDWSFMHSLVSVLQDAKEPA